MYCVIQKVENKKPNSFGEAKEIIVDEPSWVVDGTPGKRYYYRYSEERFERSIKTAYKISIHESYRDNGKVKKKQWVICTIGYYNIIDYGTWIGDYTIRLSEKLQAIGITEDELSSMVYEKLNPIIETVNREYESTEEYRAKEKHKKIIDKYSNNKEKFEKKYGDKTYDYCYDVFGVLRNEEYLKELKDSYEAQQQYKSSYYENYQSNYNNYDFGGYFKTNSNTYTEEEKEYLKIIYKAAAMKLHPDIKKDNGESMKFLNKLKDQWEI